MRKVVGTIVGVFGLAVVFVGSMVVAAQLRYYSGPFAVLVMAFGFGAAWAATPESRAMAQRVRRTLLDLGWSLKEAAIRAGLTEPQLSRQLNHVEQMSLSRYAIWGDEFWFRFNKNGVEERGALVVTNQELASIFQELQRLSERREGAA